MICWQNNKLKINTLLTIKTTKKMTNLALIAYIERETKERGLKSKSWKEVVDTIILPKMAGRENRECINDKFMLLMAFHSYDVMLESVQMHSVLQQVALQRLSKGAVLHDYVDELIPLPKEYSVYSSVHDKSHVMTEGCYEYIMSNAFEACFRDERNKKHAQEIAFGLIHYISPQGDIAWKYIFPKEFKCRGINLYTKATYLVEKHCDFETIFSHYAQEEQWQKHKLWFAQNYSKIKWSEFFKRTNALSGNFLKRFFQRQKIKRNLYKLSLPVASY